MNARRTRRMQSTVPWLWISLWQMVLLWKLSSAAFRSRCNPSLLFPEIHFQHSSPRRLLLVDGVLSSERRAFRIQAKASDSVDNRDESSLFNGVSQRRKEFLHKSLASLDIDANALNAASVQSIDDPTVGYDGRYGKSAIKTYRAFLYPKKHDEEDDSLRLNAAALRCAWHVDFLLKRHQSHETDFVRHHDAATNIMNRRTFPIILLLDNLRSAFNVGSIFRTADAAGCELVITTGITAHPNGSGAEKLQKSALGAERAVPSRHFATARDAMTFLRNEMPDYQIVGMETTDHSVPYTKHAYCRNGTVLILGNEVTGVDTTLLPLLDALVEIPMFGAKNSLNVAACAPVVLYEIIRQWNDD